MFYTVFRAVLGMNILLSWLQGTLIFTITLSHRHIGSNNDPSSFCRRGWFSFRFFRHKYHICCYDSSKPIKNTLNCEPLGEILLLLVNVLRVIGLKITLSNTLSSRQKTYCENQAWSLDCFVSCSLSHKFQVNIYKISLFSFLSITQISLQ